VIIGANGQLGTDLVKVLGGHDVLEFTRENFDVTDHAKAHREITSVRPDVIVNTAAYHRVDDCESQPETAYSVNVLAVLNLARVANEIDARFVHFSTDYVFDGAGHEPYTEQSPPMPL